MNLHSLWWKFRCFISEKQTCPDRMLNGVGTRIQKRKENIDCWHKRKNGDRTCSYCGSLHPDDFFALCRKAINGERVKIYSSTKSYKIYIERPEVKNAMNGGIKFYTGTILTSMLITI